MCIPLTEKVYSKGKTELRLCLLSLQSVVHSTCTTALTACYIGVAKNWSSPSLFKMNYIHRLSMHKPSLHLNQSSDNFLLFLIVLPANYAHLIHCNWRVVWFSTLSDPCSPTTCVFVAVIVIGVQKEHYYSHLSTTHIFNMVTCL